MDQNSHPIFAHHLQTLLGYIYIYFFFEYVEPRRGFHWFIYIYLAANKNKDTLHLMKFSKLEGASPYSRCSFQSGDMPVVTLLGVHHNYIECDWISL